MEPAWEQPTMEGKKRQKPDKMQRQSIQKTPWQLALKIQKTRQQRNWRWKSLEVRSSLLTRVLSKRIAVPWDTDHEASPAPAKRLKKDDDRGQEDQNRPSNRGQDDSHRERHSHKRSSSSRSSNGSSAGSGPSWSHSLSKSRADRPAGVGSSGNWTTADEGPAGVDSSRRRTTTDRSPAGVGSFWNWTTTGEGPARASSSWSSTTMYHPAGVGFLRVADYPRQHSGHGSGTFFSVKEGSSAVKSSWAGAGSESLTTTDKWAGAGSQSLTTAADSQGAVCSRNQTTSDKSRATSSETSPGDPSSLGVEVTADASPAGANSLKSRSAANWPDSLPGGRIIQVKIRCRLLTQLEQMTELTQPTGAHQGHSIAEARGTAGTDQADMVRVVSMATHTTGEMGHSPLSSLACRSHPYNSLLPYSVSSWWKYVGAPCFRPDYGGFA